MTHHHIAWAAALALAQWPVHGQDLCASLGAGESPPLVGTCKALAAVNAGDARRLQALMADDFALTSVSGRYFEASKAEMVQRWTEPPAPGTASVSSLARIHRVYSSGSFGFVAGEIQDQTTEHDTQTCSAHTFTDIWVLRGSGWVWLQSHESGQKTVPCRP